MKTVSMLLLSFCFLTPLFAQGMAPPPPLDDDMMTWLQGQWKGTFDGPMGRSEEWIKFDFGLDKQFLFIEATSKTGDMNYTGMGAITLDAQGNVVGDWIDNMRGRYTGKGKREGDVLTMEWEGTMGKSTRVTEKLDDNKFKVTVNMPGPDGTMGEYSGEFTRVMMSEKE